MRMKGTKFLVSIFMVVAMLTIFFGQTISYATDVGETNAFYVSLSATRTNSNPNTAYAIGNPNDAGNPVIWDLIAYAYEDESITTLANKNLYCAKGGVPESWNGSSGRVKYQYKYDIKSEKSDIELLTTNYSNVVGENYKNILWIIDNMYIPDIPGTSYEASTPEDKKALWNSAIEYYPNKQSLTYYNSIRDGERATENYPITDDDIEVVQQMALWYFTNTDKYHQDNLNNIWINNDDTVMWKVFSEYGLPDDARGAIRLEQMNVLYYYLIHAGEELGTNTYSSSNELVQPVKLQGATLEKSGDNTYLAGPFTKNNNFPFSFNITVNETTEITDYTYVDSNKQSIDVNSADEFYIMFDSTADNVSANFKLNYKITNAFLWGTEQPTASSDDKQPIIEVEKNPKSIDRTLTITPEQPFDLSLRKFITKVGDTDVDNRIPELKGWDQDNPTTIKKEHTKKAYDVKENDLVEFTIRVYNEGEVAGYAQEITDYILKDTGLEFVADNETNVTYGWTLDADGKTVRTNYLSKAVGETAGRDNLLKAFDKTKEISNSSSDKNPDYRDIKIVFKVVYPKNNGKLDRNNKEFVNIAAITEDADEDGNPIEDRDSTPRPEDTNYPDPTYNTEEHEDDIDYEPVHLLRFDLALKKYIAAVSDNAVINSGYKLDEHGEYLIDGDSGERIIDEDKPGEYITNTGRIDGVYTRAPKVTAITNNTVTYQEHDKTPEAVKSGDFVLYTFRIYNEGQTDGYASMIRDSIPDGLKFATADDAETPEEAEEIEKFNGIWVLLPKEGLDPTSEFYAKYNGWVDSNGDTIVTDYLAKGEGKENGWSVGDEDYTANLLKALKTDESGNGTVSTTTPLNPDYREIQALFKVTEPNTSTRVLVNRAQISEDSDEDGEDVTDDDSIPDEWNEGEDDQDIEKVELETMDLALRKYITKVGSTEIENRNPSIDTTSLVNEKTATYKHKKDPVEVKKGDLVTFKITAYNEGTVDGYASEITDYLPEGLEFVNKEYQLQDNTTYSWKMYKADGTETTDVSEARIIKTDALKNVKLEKRTTNTGNTENPYTLNSYSVEVQCKVKNSVEGDDILTNIADISEYRFKGNSDEDIVIKDRDSTSNNVDVPEDTNLPNYKGKDDNKPELNDSEYFYKGQEDDDDFEKVIVRTKVDLALTKFITAISNDETIEDSEYLKEADGSYTRQTAVNTNPLKNGENYAEYTQVKRPLAVENNAYVLYNIRVYNEGDVDVYAGEVTDYLPANLTFVEGEFNSNYVWTANGQTVKTTYLSYNADRAGTEEDRILKAFDSENDDGAGSGLDYADLPILCRVSSDAEAGKKLINSAEISKYEDKNGTEFPEDVDSKSGDLPEEDKNKEGKPDGRYDHDGQDDEDYEVIYTKVFDLALRKYISSIEGKPQDREPEADVTPLQNGENTAIYKHTKAPLPVNKGNKIIYTLRVYNEGDIDGYASKITDYIPEGLEFVADSEINRTYQWTEVEGSNGRKYETEYLSGPRVYIPENPAPDYSNFIIKAFDGTTLDSKYVQIELQVKDTVQVKDKLTNLAEISEYRDEEYNVINPDKDSSSDDVNIPSDTDLPGYKDDEINNEYVPGQEDDDDFEKVYIPQFDLALRKYITNIAGTEETSRIPEVSYENGKIEYKHSKSPLQVVVGDVVVYTIRVYNEGETAGYAAEIADDMPKYLTYLPENAVNTEYQWKMYDEDGNETEDVSKAVKIKTTYLSKENEETPGDNLLKAFDPTKAISDTNPDHKDVKIAFQVNNDAPVQTVITNLAQITDDTDENGNPVEDTDSTPDEWNPEDDDQDLENVIPQQFDLSLIKYVSQVIVTEDGKTTTTETKNTGNNETDIIPKVEIHRKKINSTTVKFVYTIKITNEGDIAGYAKEITDYVPEGLAFYSEDNTGWTVKEDGVIATRNLENTLLQPGESADVKVTFRWINGANNLNLKRNIAEISEDDNDKHIPDRDSTPNNKVDGEDDIDIADVLLSIKTGRAATYVLLVGAVLVVLAGGIIFIKKYAM